jgi:hypothetical protein
LRPDQLVSVVTADTLPKSGLELLPEILSAFFFDVQVKPSHYPDNEKLELTQ